MPAKHSIKPVQSTTSKQADRLRILPARLLFPPISSGDNDWKNWPHSRRSMAIAAYPLWTKDTPAWAIGSARNVAEEGEAN